MLKTWPEKIESSLDANLCTCGTPDHFTPLFLRSHHLCFVGVLSFSLAVRRMGSRGPSEQVRPLALCGLSALVGTCLRPCRALRVQLLTQHEACGCWALKCSGTLQPSPRTAVHPASPGTWQGPARWLQSPGAWLWVWLVLGSGPGCFIWQKLHVGHPEDGEGHEQTFPSCGRGPGQGSPGSGI